jgi:hypothetical protein
MREIQRGQMTYHLVHTAASNYSGGMGRLVTTAGSSARPRDADRPVFPFNGISAQRHFPSTVFPYSWPLVWPRNLTGLSQVIWLLVYTAEAACLNGWLGTLTFQRNRALTAAAVTAAWALVTARLGRFSGAAVVKTATYAVGSIWLSLAAGNEGAGGRRPAVIL